MATRGKPANTQDVVREHVLDDPNSEMPEELAATDQLPEPVDPVDERDAEIAALKAQLAELQRRDDDKPPEPIAYAAPPRRTPSAHRDPYTVREMQAMAKSSGRWVARRDMEYNGKQLDRGQLFELSGARNDARLIGYGYVGELDPGFSDGYVCAECGEAFVGVSERTSHGKLRHPNVERNPYEEDQVWDARDRMLQEAAPLVIPGPNLTNV